MERLDTIQDCGGCSPLHCVVLDVDVGPTGGSIVDGAYLIPLVNGCKGAWSWLTLVELDLPVSQGLCPVLVCLDFQMVEHLWALGLLLVSLGSAE